MKICFLSRYQNQTLRGAESFVAEISKRLTSFEVEVLSGVQADELSQVLKGSFDIVIPINGRLQALKASLGRVIGKYKTVITGHSGIGRDDIINLLTRPDVFVALTDYAKNWALKYSFGVKVSKIPNGVDMKKFNPDGPKVRINLPKPIILSVGALVEAKNHHLSIDSVASLSTGSLVIVGSGEQQQELQAYLEHKLPNRGQILKLSYQQMPQIYRSADLFLLPSWDRESFGIVYLEAMATNLPVIAPQDPVREEIIGDAGILVSGYNNIEYSKKISEALGTNFADKPLKQAEKFSWKRIVKEYGELFKSLKD